MQTGQRIREYRTTKGMTQGELAGLVKTNVRTIQRIENGQVKARVYTLTAIAQALEIEYELLAEKETVTDAPEDKVSKGKLAWLHLGGLILLPTLAIWWFEKDEAKSTRQHIKDVINFQLSMLTILIPCLIFPAILLVLAVFTLAVVLVNAITVAAGGNYYYPFSIGFLKG